MKLALILGAPLALAACGNVTEPIPAKTLAAAANVDTQTVHASTSNLLSGYVKRPVGGPAPWRELNDQQSPNQGDS